MFVIYQIAINRAMNVKREDTHETWKFENREDAEKRAAYLTKVMRADKFNYFEVREEAN